MRLPVSLGVVSISVLVALSGCASAPSVPFDSQDLSITVDYGQPLADLIRSGGYGWVYSEINDRNFPPVSAGSRTESVRLVRLDPLVPIDTLVSREKGNGWRAADLEELLTFGRAYPDFLRGASVVGFGSSRVYPTISYINYGMGTPMSQWTVITTQNFYPTLTRGLFGQSLVLMQEDMIPLYDPPGFYACFVRDTDG